LTLAQKAGPSIEQP